MNTERKLSSAVCVKQGGGQGGEGLMVPPGFFLSVFIRTTILQLLVFVLDIGIRLP